MPETTDLELSIRRSFRARMAIPDHKGMCRSPHGYRFYVTLTIAGKASDTHPWMMDVLDVEEMLDTRIIAPLQGADLTQKLTYPSLEGILLWIVGQLAKDRSRLKSVRLDAPPAYSVIWKNVVENDSL